MSVFRTNQHEKVGNYDKYNSKSSKLEQNQQRNRN
jgi:hypothetical protein